MEYCSPCACSCDGGREWDVALQQCPMVLRLVFQVEPDVADLVSGRSVFRVRPDASQPVRRREGYVGINASDRQ